MLLNHITVNNKTVWNRLFKREGAKLDCGYGEPDHFLKFLGAKPGASLLDIGCGAGHLLNRAPQGILKVGVDIAEEGLKVAQSVSPDSKLTIVDQTRLPFPSECFDYITNIGALPYASIPSTAAQEMVRVLKSDGKACIEVLNKN